MNATGRSSSGVQGWEWVFVVVLLLLAWGLRLCLLEEVPPGWRDDELINIHTLSNQLLEGRFPLYYLGASGHEPLYHHLHAGVHAVLGFNVLSGHILSASFGLLSIVLTYALVRRLFPTERATAAVAALSLTASFWSLMYSRTAMRHISLPPLTLATLYAFWRQIDASDSRIWSWVPTGLLLAATLYTYTASRLLPVLLALVAAYLALFHRDLFQRHWRGIAVAFAIMALLVMPLGVAIAQGRTQTAIEGIGADARVTELARPLRALWDGDPKPLLKSTGETLGMFHSTGDPEWLYNIAGRSVFNLLGGILVWAGVLLCLCRWRQPRYFLLLSWLGLGLFPAFISTPPASLSHTIFAQPVAYILPSLALIEIYRNRGDWSGSHRMARMIPLLLVASFVVSNAIRDLRDYFLIWPQQEMVRILYRADYREVADYLNSQANIEDAAVASTLLGPWDRLALDVDTRSENIDVRLFDPGRGLVCPAERQGSTVILMAWPPAHRVIRQTLQPYTAVSATISPSLRLYDLSTPSAARRRAVDPCMLQIKDSLTGPKLQQFSNGLALIRAFWLDRNTLIPGKEAELITAWVLTEPIDLPPIPIVANPPPPGTYAGPRLAVFAHLLASDIQAEEELSREHSTLAVDDGLWVDPLTLELGDRFVQIHRFRIPEDADVESYEVELGLYDPMTGARWPVLDAEGSPVSDRVLIQAENLAPPALQ